MIRDILLFGFNLIPEGLFKHKIRCFFVYNNFGAISYMFPLKGYERYYTLKKGDVVLDLGAYMGGFTILASNKVGATGKVIAFEPDKNSLRILRKVVSKHKLKNIIIVENKVNSLDFEMETLKLPKIDFIKMDVEGDEIEILKNSKKTLQKYKPNLAIASYHIIHGHKTYTNVEQILRKYGYVCITSNKNHLTTYARYKR